MAAAWTFVAIASCNDDSERAIPVLDQDSSNANVVVKVGQCSGILLTPRIALTASHCIRGAERPAGPMAEPCSGDSIPYVSVGPDWLSPYAVFETKQAVTKMTGCQPTNRYGDDLAVVYLSGTVVASARTNASWNVPRIVRPSLVFPPKRGDHYEPVPIFSGYSPWNDDYTKWSFPKRRVQSLVHSDIEYGSKDTGTYIQFELRSGYGLHAGDSGGPVFVERPDGSRDPIAVATMVRGSDSFATDLTGANNRAWLLDHVTERGVAAMTERGELSAECAHSPSWLARHGKTLDDWWGELDYSGPCDARQDHDCDGWWDHADVAASNHDDCSRLSDPEQIDTGNGEGGAACDADGSASAMSKVSDPKVP